MQQVAVPDMMSSGSSSNKMRFSISVPLLSFSDRSDRSSSVLKHTDGLL